MYEILSGDDFRKNYGGVYRSIFYDRVVRRASFNKPDWKYAITTAGFLKVEGNFEALSHAAACAGDERIVCTEIESANNGLTAVFAETTRPFLRFLRTNAVVCLPDSTQRFLLNQEDGALWNPKALFARVDVQFLALRKPSSTLGPPN